MRSRRGSPARCGTIRAARHLRGDGSCAFSRLSWQEVGDPDPLMASGVAAERAQRPTGAEIGPHWIFDRQTFALSALGRVRRQFSQNFSAATVSLGIPSIIVHGAGEGRYGADAAGSASLSEQHGPPLC
jgi:hypothetical protein